MTAFGIQLGWLAIRVTVIALIAVPLVWWSARRAARSAVVVLAATMTIFLALSAAAFCPAPAFCRWSPAPAGWAETSARDEAPVVLGRAAQTEGFDLVKAWSSLHDLAERTPQSSAWQQGNAILLAIYVLGLAIASLRLLSGWLAVRALRRRSHSITDVGVLALVDSLRGILGCSRKMELRECDEPGLAATVGLWRPVIFLPPEWLDWSAGELRAVLAHEMSHIHNRDYLISLLTRLCQAVYVYHPLIHWLAAQVRWQQELAADDLAASALADRNGYLKALASLALRSPARMSAGAMPWSAMAGSALLRRIQMLRGTKNIRPLGWTMRGLLIGILAGVGVLLATLGSPATPPDRKAQKAEPFEIGYLHPDARGFIAIRPAFLLRQPGMEKVTKKITDEILKLKKLGITIPDALKPENIEEIVTDFDIASLGTGKPGSRTLRVGTFSFYLRLNQDFDWPAYARQVSKEVGVMTGKAGFEVTELRGEMSYRVGAVPLLGPLPIYFHQPDRRSVVFSGLVRNAGDPAAADQAFRQLIQDVAKARKRDWGGYAKAARAPIAAVLDNHDGHYGEVLANDLQPNELKLLESIHVATVGIEVGDRRPVRLIVDAKSAALAPELEKTAGVVVRSLRQKVQEAKSEDHQDKITARLATELLQSGKLHREGARLEWVGFSSVRIHDLFDHPDAKTPRAQSKSD